jgi:site-specific DNA-methyltransferase (adenine-specific)
VFPKGKSNNVFGDGLNGNKRSVPIGKGRFPANILLSHHIACVCVGGKKAHWNCHPDCPVKLTHKMERGSYRFFYIAKVDRREREAGLEGIPTKYLATMGDGIGNHPHNPEQPSSWVKNNHPTVKPIALCRYLATLILPPWTRTPRRILVPYSGSGSEMIGALQANWDCITGIEQESEYITIAKERLKHYYNQEQQYASD